MADTIPGDSSTTANINVGGTVNGNLDYAGDHDWFAITLTAGQAVTISLSGVGQGGVIDPYLYLRDSAGNLLTSNDDIVDGTDRNSQINFNPSYSGTYYIDAGAWNEQFTGTYQLSVKPYTPPPLATNDQIADQLVYGFWGGESQHFNVTQGGTITVDISALNASEQTLARAALAEWTDIIGVRFQEVTTGARADIQFDHSGPGAIAATDSDTANGIITHSHVHISTGWVNNYGTSLYSYSFQTYVHEIGHALGLGHAGNYNGTADYPYDALFQNDAWSTSIMSYFDQNENSYFANQGFSRDFAVTPMAADVLAMQTLYGLSTTTRTGDTTYGYNTSAGGIYDANAYPKATYTIFDSGGNDTLDFSGSAANQLINLNPETFSNVNGQVGNISIARGVVIENAIGGSGADTLIGNLAVNVLKGGSGNDTLTGGSGNDTFFDTRAGHNGDTITDFNVGDKLVFSDVTLGTFAFSLSGSTLNYSGGTLTLNGLSGGKMVASAGSGGGVQLLLVTSTNLNPTPAHNDFNGDGRSDILWRNDAGQVSNWLATTSGGFNANAGSVTSMGAEWTIAGIGDFHGDGRAGLLVRNDNGLLTEWVANVGGSYSATSTALPVGLDWHVFGVGDFNGDGRSDVLWEQNGGALINWLGQANGNFTSNAANFSTVVGTEWRIMANGDYNGDGRSDILWRKDGSGEVMDWLGTANGGFVTNSTSTVNVGLDWHISGTGDFNGDGIGDILWRQNGGATLDWLGTSSGAFASNSANFSTVIGTEWRVEGIGDYNGDGHDDILWRQDGSGHVTNWLGTPNGGFITNAANLDTTVPTTAHVQDPFLPF